MLSLWDTIYYNRGLGASNGNNYWKQYAAAHYILCAVTALLISLGIGFVSLFVCSAYLDKLDWTMFLSYLSEPLILTLNLIPPVLLTAAGYFAFGRLWAGFLAGGGLVTVFSLINFYKIRLRTEPFTASDLALTGEAAGIISRYKLEITGRVLLITCALAAGTLAAAFLARGKIRSRRVRAAGTAACLALCAALFFGVYSSDSVYAAATNGSVEYDYWSELERFVSKGFVYPFLYSVKSAVKTPPAGYSEAEAKSVLAQYADEDIPAEKKVNIFAVQLEAFTDLTEFGVAAYDFVYEPYHALCAESMTGRFVANTFGGGTQVSERTFITGFTAENGWRRNTNSAAWYLRSQGYATEGFHQNDGWYYNRVNVNRSLGFERYDFMDSLPEPSRKDDVFFEKLRSMWESRDKTRPYFNFSVSYQNHGAYYSNWTMDERFLERGGLSEPSFCILNNYLYGISDTTARMYDFCHYFDSAEEPVVVVFYGDHMPWMGDGNSVLGELGVSIDLGTEEGFLNYYSTPYVVWANAAAKAVSDGSFTGDGGTMSSSFLLDRVFEEIGFTGSAWNGVLRDTRRTIDVINGSGIWRIDGKLTLTPDALKNDAARKFLYAQYYREGHFSYGELTE